jgi:DNA-binding NarL/FixJ family response regulator
MIGRFLTDMGFTIAGESSLQEGRKLLETLGMPMAVIMVDRGIEALELIRDIETICDARHIFQPRMLLWSEYDNYTHIIGALNFNLWKSTSSHHFRWIGEAPRSFIGKEEGVGELITAIEKTAAGTGYLAPRLAKKIRKLSPIVNSGLTGRESDIFGYVQLGFTNDEIADRLGVKKHSVENAFRAICKKMGAANREKLYWL